MRIIGAGVGAIYGNGQRLVFREVTEGMVVPGGLGTRRPPPTVGVDLVGVDELGVVQVRNIEERYFELRCLVIGTDVQTDSDQVRGVDGLEILRKAWQLQLAGQPRVGRV